MCIDPELFQETSFYSIPRFIRGGAEAKAALTPILQDREIECFVIIHLGDDLDNLQFTCHRGGPGEVLSPARKILSDAVELGTKGLLLAHNHPSGDLTPSAADLRATRCLASACKALDLTLIDHFIYGKGDWFSFREEGYL